MSLERLAPLAAAALFTVACADPFSPDDAVSATSVSADLGAPLSSGTARIMCGTYIVAYSPTVLDSTVTLAEQTIDPATFPNQLADLPPVNCGDAPAAGQLH